jgi:hypothetical protein
VALLDCEGHEIVARRGPAPTLLTRNARFKGDETMKKLMLVIALLLTGVGLSACKYESSSLFDNNCSGNDGIRNEAHCKGLGT